MGIDRLRDLVELALNSDTNVSEWFESGLQISVIRSRHTEPEQDGDTPLEEQAILCSMFGQVHLHTDADRHPFVSLGQTIVAGQQVAVVEAMKSFCPVIAQRAGRIVEILVKHGAEVSFGQPLFRFE